MEQLKQVVRERAAYIYRHADTPQTAVADIEHVQDISAGEAVRGVGDADRRRQDLEASKLSNQLDTQRKQLEADRAEQQEQKDRLDNAKAGARGAHRAPEEAARPGRRDPGDGRRRAHRGRDHRLVRGPEREVPPCRGMPIADLVQLYMEEGKAEHVRPELAFAQSIIETGSFGNALDNNYAGIGACDSCQGEPAFPTPRDGVRGQIQLLQQLRRPDVARRTLANPPSPTIYGNDPVRGGELVRHVLRQGPHPDLERDGQRQLGDRPGLRAEGAHGVLPDGELRREAQLTVRQGRIRPATRSAADA